MKKISITPKATFEIVIKNLKDTDGCCGCKYVHDSIEICKLRDCWRAIKPKDAYEDKEGGKNYVLCNNYCKKKKWKKAYTRTI